MAELPHAKPYSSEGARVTVVCQDEGISRIKYQVAHLPPGAANASATPVILPALLEGSHQLSESVLILPTLSLSSRSSELPHPFTYRLQQQVVCC